MLKSSQEKAEKIKRFKTFMMSKTIDEIVLFIAIAATSTIATTTIITTTTTASSTTTTLVVTPC